eukprot:TRINITY_DN6078_c0_g2_i2.p2 TRINITY_DN6078_c0_g2~~TRINITY_DN6078_c0_g2_i2.p2  ORF type:complete len:233 (+),score=5.99 TRINITY_DN6078_c0_g2_i2:1452-2150(+)
MAFSDLKLSGIEGTIKKLGNALLEIEMHTSQTYTNSIYALSILNAPIEIVQKFVDRLISDKCFSLKAIPSIQLTQLRRAQLEFKSRNMKLKLPDNLQKLCISSAQERAKQQQHMKNEFLDTMYVYFQQTGIVCQKMVQILDGEINVDILVNGGKKRQIIIKVHVHKDYTMNTVNSQVKILGRSQSAVDLLKRFNFKVVSVSALEWHSKKRYKNQVVKTVRNLVKQSNEGLQQ